MRGLSPTFITALQTGILAGLRQRVIADKDLDLQIRTDYLNVYYKGNSLLKLTELSSNKYRVTIDPKFLGNLTLPNIHDEATAKLFLDAIPQLKEAVVASGKKSLEVEYEQLIIRANNLEPRTNSEYFIVDRQYARGTARFDLLGLCWPSDRRKRGQVIAPCCFEIKFALNTDIQEIQHQLQSYYDLIAADASNIAAEIEHVFRQKLDLGLFLQSQDRLHAMATLEVGRRVEDFQFIVVLVDYNPYSTLFTQAEVSLAALPFANQIRIFKSGFAIWQQSLLAPAEATL